MVATLGPENSRLIPDRMPKIVVLDGFTLNPGDLSWGPINSHGDVIVYDRTTPSEIIDRCLECEIVLTNKVDLSGDTLKKLQLLRFISVLATGFNIIDVETASELGIVVSNVPSYGTQSVAQHTFALILEVYNSVGIHASDVSNGGWIKDFSYTLKPIPELSGKTLGIFGWGKIGRQVAQIGLAFGMKVIVHSQYPDNEDIKFVSLPELFSKSDVVTIHSAFSNEKTGMINKELLNLMKPGGILINTSRGQIINEEDLAIVLNNGRLAGAGLDVLIEEPPNKEHPLIHARNCIVTPHIAWAAREARERLMEITAENIKAYLEGNPVNRVN